MAEEKTVEEMNKDLAEQLKAMQEQVDKLKAANTTASADTSKYKKLLAEKESEAEKSAREQQEKFEQMEKKLADYERKNKVAENKAQFLAAGFNEELAEKSATAMADGDYKTFFDSLGKFTVAHEQSVTEKIMKGTGKPAGTSGGAKAVTKEQFGKMSLKEQNELYVNNRELYNELIK